RSRTPQAFGPSARRLGPGFYLREPGSAQEQSSGPETHAARRASSGERSSERATGRSRASWARQEEETAAPAPLRRRAKSCSPEKARLPVGVGEGLRPSPSSLRVVPRLRS